MIVILYEKWPCSDRNTQAALVAKGRALKITSLMHYGNPSLRSAWGFSSAFPRALVKEVCQVFFKTQLGKKNTFGCWII
jgi:hypothetical protein